MYEFGWLYNPSQALEIVSSLENGAFWLGAGL